MFFFIHFYGVLIITVNIIFVIKIPDLFPTFYKLSHFLSFFRLIEIKSNY